MISIIIPACNEALNIQRFPQELLPPLKILPEIFELVIVDDGSKDDTLAASNTIKELHGNVTIVQHQQNLGLGKALRTGIAHAKGEIVITIDADLTFSPNDIPILYEKYRGTGADCVIGSHFIHPDGFAGVGFHRIFLSRCVNFLYRIILGEHITAISSIFRLYKKNAIKDMQIESKGFTVNAEILLKLLKQKYVIVEVPVILTTRKFGVSKLKTFDEIKNHLFLLWKTILWKLKGTL